MSSVTSWPRKPTGPASWLATGMCSRPDIVSSGARSCVKKKVFAKSITVMPGKNTSSAVGKWSPFGQYVVLEPKNAHPQWVSTLDELLRLRFTDVKENPSAARLSRPSEASRSATGAAGQMGGTPGSDVLPPAGLLGKSVFVAGYPAKKCGANPMGKVCLPPGRGGGTQYVASDIVADLSPRDKPLQLRYRADCGRRRKRRAGLAGRPGKRSASTGCRASWIGVRRPAQRRCPHHDEGDRATANLGLRRLGWRDEFIIDCHCHAGHGDGLTGPWDTAATLGRLPAPSGSGGHPKDGPVLLRFTRTMKLRTSRSRG